MSSLLKDIYSPPFFDRFANILTQTVDSFDKESFINQILTEDFNSKELKERMKHTSKVLHQFFPADYAECVKLIEKIIAKLREVHFGEDSLVFMFIPDYIETYGIDDFENSIRAIEFVTQFVSCEFAIRPFLLKYGDQMISQMIAWSEHENYKVRRLASEGSRPRLPWAMAIPALKKDPAAILPLLENLKNDPSEWVRRSVANNLNDIAKDHPDLVINIATSWKGHSKETDAIIKHGCRTLLKQGHTEVLKHYGLQSENVSVSSLNILTSKVKTGDSLEFSFSIVNMDKSKQIVRLEYAIYYKKQNGTLSKKVFKISEKVYQPDESAVIRRKQSFKLITTRTFYVGDHQLSIIVNGEEKAIDKFELIA